MKHRARVGLIVGVTALFLLIGLAPASAALKPATVEVTKTSGQVEILRKGQTVWTRAASGAKLGEDDQIRTYGGASADLTYPDGSTMVLAENTRFGMAKIQYDASTGGRNFISHLAVGKIVSSVKKASVQLVRARQGNFLVTTPVGVAAVRGTEWGLSYNPATGEVTVVSFGDPSQTNFVVTFTGFGGQKVTVTVTNGQYTVVAGDKTSGPFPVTTMKESEFKSRANPGTAGSPQLTGPVNIMVTIPPAVTGEPQAASEPTWTFVGPPPTTVPIGTIGVDLIQSCASPPCR